jgi:hypothetical protein
VGVVARRRRSCSLVETFINQIKDFCCYLHAALFLILAYHLTHDFFTALS